MSVSTEQTKNTFTERLIRVLFVQGIICFAIGLLAFAFYANIHKIEMPLILGVCCVLVVSVCCGLIFRNWLRGYIECRSCDAEKSVKNGAEEEKKED